ncbi:MAG: DegT/DnrJ/EryC1/StrS family aminotransferase [Thermodesulfobacteriota bacterium]|nr:DegT/DnrJ/EryC1/StrS family aminotransferase [Thermodesulfobacteriota bacterium]
MTVPLLDLKAQYRAIRDEIVPALEEVLESQYFILGPKVSRLEGEVAAYSKCLHAVGVSSGSDALLICLMAEEIGPGDEVITTPYTFFATAGVISRTGATPVFVDIAPDTYNMASHLIEERITPRTRAIIPVHLYGQCADMDPILEIANRHGLVVIEDAAQAIGAEYVSTTASGSRICRAGSMGHYGCFSFFPSKNLGGFGDGGMVVTSDSDRAQRLRILRVHGSEPKYYHEVVGGNFRLDAIQAAVLSVKLRYLDGWTAKRQENAAWYERALASSGLVEKGLVSLPKAVWKEAFKEAGGHRVETGALQPHHHIYNQFVISTPRRDELRAYLTERGVGTEVYYPVPLHLQECFQSLGYPAGSFPVSEEAAKKTLALPIYPELTSEQKEYVVASVSGFWA